MSEYLKLGRPEKVERSTEMAETVSRILSDVEREGLPAVRRYSQQLDQWDPDSFVVPVDQVAKAAAEVGDELAGHLEFARSPVERFALEQRATMTDLEVETQPGVVFGHRHVPVGSVGSYAPGGRYPLIASSIMTVTVPKGRRRRHRDRAALVAADLLGQAEPGFNSPALLVTTSREFGQRVIAEVGRWLGSLFIGPALTVAYSDTSIGTNHVLPTGRYTGGLWVGKLLKTVTYQRLTADAELMYGHALTARLRLEFQG